MIFLFILSFSLNLLCFSYLLYLTLTFWSMFDGYEFSKGFLNLGNIDMSDQIIFSCQMGEREYSMYCRMFNSFTGLYPLDANSMPPVVITKNIFRCCYVTSGGQKHLWLMSNAPRPGGKMTLLRIMV